ncbi:MAG: hypothetical protein V4735_07295 [Pseudomonadota bacterium]
MIGRKNRDKIDHKTHVDVGLGISVSEWVISGAIGLSSGLLAAGATIRDRFSEEVKKWPGIKELRVSHRVDLENANLDFSGQPGNWKAHQVKVDGIKEAYALKRDAVLLEKYGIQSRGVKTFSYDTLKGLTYGTWQRFGFSGKSTEGRIIFNSVVGALIGAAATLSFFNGVASRHKIEQIADATVQSEKPPVTPDVEPETAPEDIAEKPAKPSNQLIAVKSHQKMEAANDASLAQRA